MEHYFLNYASLEQQRWMVADEPRTTAFARAIAEVVKPGDVVIDVGAGTGVLSLLAAKAGARRVIAVERSGMAAHARQLIEHNGMSDIIEVFEGDAHQLVLDEEADVIVSEWLGHMAYVENMFDVVMAVRDAWLKPGGVMIPATVDLMLAPVDAADLHDDFGAGFWQRDIHGIDFSCFTKVELDMGYAKKLELPAELVIGPGERMHTLETVSAKPGDEWSEGSIVLTIKRGGMLSGFVGWFSTQLSPNVVLDTSPHKVCTHWEQTFFPFHPIEVKTGEEVPVDFWIDDPFPGSRLMEMMIKVGGEKIRYLVD